jgi:hypothetical protein
MLLALAVSLHVFAVHSPQPQEPAYSAFASRLISSILVAPPLPLAPPLQVLAQQRPMSSRRVSVKTTLLKIPVPSEQPRPARPPAFEPTLVAVSTTGGMTRSAAPEPRATLGSPLASGSTVTDSAAPAERLPDPRPPATPPSTLAPAHDARAEPALVAADRVSRAADRAAFTDRRDTAPLNAVDVQRQQDVVLSVVRQYARALERLDLGATRAVYPTVDSRELQRAFAGLKGQQFHIASCGVSFSTSGDDANARCTGNATFRPKIGSRVVRLTDYEWVISLARGGGGWQILEARIQ